MRKIVPIILCLIVSLLTSQRALPARALDADGADARTKTLPRAFLPREVGSIKLRMEGESITITGSRLTLEEILQRIAQEKRVILRLYCDDPSLKQERPANLAISADSLAKALGQLLGENYRFILLNQEGKPTGDGGDVRNVAAVNIYPMNCDRVDEPVRLFIAEKDHPVLRRPSDEISVDELCAVIKREGPASRRLAADILGAKGEEKGIVCATEALRDENPAVMFAGARALRRLGEKYGSEKVADAVYERFLERPYAEFLPIVAALDKEKIWPIVDALIDQRGQKEQGAIVNLLVSTGDKRAIRYLSRVAFSGSAANSAQAIYGIGKIGGSEAATELMRLLREGDGQRRAKAAQAVYFLKKGDAADARAEVERMARDERVSDTLLEALAEVSYLEPLEKLMRDPALNPEIKIRAVNAMANRGAEKTLDVIGVGLDDKAPQVRIASVQAMEAIAVEAAVPYLVKASEDKEPNVRCAAVKALSGFPGDDDVVRALGRAMQDTDENVRRGAMDAVKLLGRPSEAEIAILRESKNHKDPYVANEARSTLKYWGLE